MRLAFLFTLMLSCGSASAAETWRSVDKNGVVHYSDTARPGAKFLEVKPASGNGPDGKTLARTEACKQQKADLERYRAATGLQQTDALGNVHPFTEQERMQFLEKTEKAVKDACGPPPAPAEVTK